MFNLLWTKRMPSIRDIVCAIWSKSVRWLRLEMKSLRLNVTNDWLFDGDAHVVLPDTDGVVWIESNANDAFASQSSIELTSRQNFLHVSLDRCTAIPSTVFKLIFAFTKSHTYASGDFIHQRCVGFANVMQFATQTTRFLAYQMWIK